MSERRHRWFGSALVVMVVATGCSKGGPVESFGPPASVDTTTPGPTTSGLSTTTTSTGGSAALAAEQQIAGNWVSPQYGAMVVRPIGAELRAAYDHSGGTIVGTYVAAEQVWRGWWSQLPTRSPPANSGEVEFVFPDGVSGNRAIGRWRYGTTGAWRSDWVLSRSPAASRADLVSRFDQPSEFVAHP